MRGNQALHHAVTQNDVIVTKALIEAGCNVNVLKPDGSVLLHLMVSKYDSSQLTDFRLILETLLLRGCNLNTLAYNTLETPLYRAIGLHKHDLAEILLAYGADPNISSPFDITALQLAYTKESSQAVQMMLHCVIDWKREKWLKQVPMSQVYEPQTNGSGDMSNNLLKMIFEWKNKSNSLQNLCRIGIRKHYGDNLIQNLDTIDKLPNPAKNFLLLADIRSNSLVQRCTDGATTWFSDMDYAMGDGRTSEYSNKRPMRACALLAWFV